MSTYKNTIRPLLIISLLLAIVGIGYLLTHDNPQQNTATSGPIQVVAGENFWGNLLSQIGGTHIQVLSVISDPNADPHEYETSTTDARAFATARYVVVNGAGYDSWANKLIAGNPTSSRKVLAVADLLGKKVGDNPHFWYSPTDVNLVIKQMEHDLIAIDPAHTQYFEQQYTALQSSLATYQNRIMNIKTHYAGTKVAATEDIFTYLAEAAGLDLISPPSFIQAVAEGNDPPTTSIVEFQQQLQSNQAKLLVYNKQTVTPLTENMKNLATKQNIPLIGFTETIQPPHMSFQDWMDSQVMNLENALAAKAPAQ